MFQSINKVASTEYTSNVFTWVVKLVDKQIPVCKAGPCRQRSLETIFGGNFIKTRSCPHLSDDFLINSCLCLHVFIGDTSRDFGPFWRPVCIWWKKFYWLFKNAEKIHQDFSYSYLAKLGTSIFLIFSTHNYLMVTGINGWTSTDLARILLRRWENFHRHVGGIYYLPNTNWFGDKFGVVRRL